MADRGQIHNIEAGHCPSSTDERFVVAERGSNPAGERDLTRNTGVLLVLHVKAAQETARPVVATSVREPGG